MTLSREVLQLCEQNKPKKMWQGNDPKTSTCDMCGQPFSGKWFVDGQTGLGSWALMCQSCFGAYGVGIGPGQGQKYDLQSLEKIGG